MWRITKIFYFRNKNKKVNCQHLFAYSNLEIKWNSGIGQKFRPRSETWFDTGSSFTTFGTETESESKIVTPFRIRCGWSQRWALV